MTTFALIRNGMIGATAVAAPAAVLFLLLGLTWSSEFAMFVVYIPIYGMMLAVVAGLAWACVRFSHFSPRVAIVLTTLPLSLLTALMIPLISQGFVSPLVFWGVQFGGAVLAARFGTRYALAGSRGPIA